MTTSEFKEKRGKGTEALVIRSCYSDGGTDRDVQ